MDQTVVPGIHIEVGHVAEGATGIVVKQHIHAPAASPALTWQALPADCDLFSVLSWRCRLVPGMIGRAGEAQSLLDWAKASEPRARLLWLSGPGGAGKSRLAAELCESLLVEGWKAGFVSWNDPVALPSAEHGIFLVLDYPEEHRARALEWIRKLASLPEEGPPVRAVLVSRHGLAAWEDDVKAAHAWHICDRHAVPSLAALGADECVQLFQEVCDRFASHYGHERPRVETSAIVAWHGLAPAIHGLPLFVSAAAIHAVLESQRPLSLRGGAVMRALAEREAARLNGLSSSLGMGARTPARLCALAAVGGGLDSAGLRRLAAPELGLGLPPPAVVVDAVSALPWWQKGRLDAPTPDVLAAALVHHVLGRESDQERTAEWLWAALDGSRADAIDRLGKLCFDFDLVTHGTDAEPLGEHLARMIDPEREEHRARAWSLASLTQDDLLPYGLTRLAIAVGYALVAELSRKSRDGSEDVLPDLSACLGSLAGLLARSGYRNEALELGRRAVEIARALEAHDASLFQPLLAGSLSALSFILREAGHRHEAVEVIQEAVTFHRTLAQDNSALYLEHLALSVNHLGLTLAEVGRNAEGLQYNQESLAIYRQLAKDAPDRFRLDVATGLNNVSNRLGEVGRTEEALQAIEEAVAMSRELALDSPARVLPVLAMGLNNLANKLDDMERTEDALAVNEEAIRHRQMLAESDPGRFLPELATSLNNLALKLDEVGRHDEARATLHRAIAMRRGLAEMYPLRFRNALARSLGNLALLKRRSGNMYELITALQEAVTIYRELAREIPARFREHLAGSLQKLATTLLESGRIEAAIEAITEAVSICRILVAEDPERFRPHLVDSLHFCSKAHLIAQRPEEALGALDEVIPLCRTMAAETPSAAVQQALATALSNRSMLLAQAGHTQDAVSSAREAVMLSRGLLRDDTPRRALDLARCLDGLARRLDEAERRDEAIEARQEAAGHYRYLMNSLAEDVGPELATCLHNLGIGLAEAGRLQEASPVAEECIALRRAQAETDLAAVRPGLARSLGNLGLMRARAERVEESVVPLRESVEHYRVLCAGDPARFAPDLVSGLLLLSDCLHHLEQAEEAEKVFEEARQLAPVLQGAMRQAEERHSDPDSGNENGA